MREFFFELSRANRTLRQNALQPLGIVGNVWIGIDRQIVNRVDVWIFLQPIRDCFIKQLFRARVMIVEPAFVVFLVIIVEQMRL